MGKLISPHIIDSRKRGYVDHSTLSEIKATSNEDGLDFESMYKFTVVRNTWDRISSAYFHGKLVNGSSLTRLSSKYGFSDFEGFVYNILFYGK